MTRSVDAKPDVAGLLAEVEAAVAAKKSQGLYNPAEVRRVEEAAVTLQVDPDGQSMERLAAYLRENWDAKSLRHQHPPRRPPRAGWWWASSAWCTG